MVYPTHIKWISVLTVVEADVAEGAAGLSGVLH